MSRKPTYEKFTREEKVDSRNNISLTLNFGQENVFSKRSSCCYVYTYVLYIGLHFKKIGAFFRSRDIWNFLRYFKILIYLFHDFTQKHLTMLRRTLTGTHWSRLLPRLRTYTAPLPSYTARAKCLRTEITLSSTLYQARTLPEGEQVMCKQMQ